MSGDTAGLSGVLKRGAAMSAIGLVIAQTATIVQTVVLGRILGPEQVGIFMAGSILIGILVTVSQGALVQAVIHCETDVDEAANTALIATFVAGLLGTAAILAVSPLIGALFHSPEAALIAAATSGLMVLHVAASVPDALMQRRFQFKRQMFITPAVSITFAAVSIVFAVRGSGPWAMVIGWYASSIVAVLLSWWMAKWRPFGARFSFRRWRAMAAYSFPLLLDSFADRLREVVEQVIVGRFLGTDVLGQYRYAYRIASLPSLAIITVCSHVLFPAFSRISDDDDRFRQAFLRALGWIWFVAAPAGAMLVCLGEPIVVLLLGEEWRQAGVATAAMVGIGLGAAVNAVTCEALKGAGRSKLLNWSPAICLGIGLPAVLLLAPFGLVGVGIAVSVTCLIVGLVNLELAHSVVGLSRRSVLTCLAAPAGSALIAMAVVLPADRFLVRADSHAVLPGLLWVSAEAGLFILLYLASLSRLSPARYQTLHNGVKKGWASLRLAPRRS